MRPDGGRDIHWPRSEFFAWHPEGRDGLLLFSGPEPHQRWRTYTTAFLGVAERCGVRQIVSLGALLAGAPHTRPVRVTARSNDSAARSLLEAWGIYSPPTYEGPTGISSVVLDAAERRGIQHVGFMGQAPHYLPDSENPAAIQTLVSYVARLLNLSPDMSHFAEAIQEFRTQCDQAVARDDPAELYFVATNPTTPPDVVSARAGVARLLEKQGKAADARALWDELVGTPPGKQGWMEAHYQSARLSVALGDQTRACTVLRQVPADMLVNANADTPKRISEMLRACPL